MTPMLTQPDIKPRPNPSIALSSEILSPHVRLLDHSIVVSETVTEKVNTIKEATIRGIMGEDCRISKDAHNWLLQL